MSLQADAGAGKGQAPFCRPLLRSKAIREATPTAGGLRSGLGDEQSQRVLERASTSTPSSERMPFSAVGWIQASARAACGRARNTIPFMLPI